MEQGGDNRRVLIVDDHVGGAEALKIGLKLHGFDVRAAHDGLSALEVAVEFRPEVVVLDLALPMLNGWEVARRMRSMPLFRRPRLIAVTGFTDPAHRARSMSVGFDHHLTKPFSLGDLRRLLDEQPAEACG